MEANKPFGEQRRAVLTADQQKKFDDMRRQMAVVVPVVQEDKRKARSRTRTNQSLL